MANELEPTDDDRVDDLVSEITAALRQAVGMGRGALDNAGSVVRDAVHARIEARVAMAIAEREVGTSAQGLAIALAPPSPSLLNRGVQVAGSKALRKALPLRMAARRSPVGLALTLGPALVSVIRSTVNEVDSVAAHLAARARQFDIEPHPTRLTVATVQAVAGVSMNPDASIPYDHLARQWIKAGASELVPWGGGRTNKDLADLVGRVADFDVTALEHPDD